MRVSKKGIDLIKQFEGCKLSAYYCPAGVCTIGYGHTMGVRPGDTITQKQADDLLSQDLLRFENEVSKYDHLYHWSQNQFDALVSFAYNIGNIGNLTRQGHRSKDVISEKMLLYVKAGGVTLPGLVRRRKAERDLFITPDKRRSKK